ncbi:Small glutamine-rich tetratricopeptide repeat-containing protein 2 [Polyrhizophydium stewartii]|uniref:Small glutamine-rich tetratricopeptide repeat-containing protein 2 n=1 Tax=Polyrhizophydium stewartii TaxID=2732419 RepID=A0ABR4NIZ0_9FUNG|nr:hypothetical protein HK105_006859 [Polyrhizophydium stewartii]
MSDTKKKLAFAICQYLQDNIKDGTIKTDDVEGIEVAIQCIGEAFGVDPADAAQQEQYSIKPANLVSVFDVVLATQRKLSEKAEAAKAAAKATAEPAGPTPEQKKAKAEELKAAGNKLMAAKSYAEAIAKYTEAIELDGANAVYYANRAAAQSQAGDHHAAAADARKAIEIDPKYSKGYSRLGHALFCLGEYSESIEAYEDGLKIEPGNISMINAVKAATAKLETSPAPRAGPSAGGMPDLGGLDFASMMSNPDIMRMASQMMGNPQIAQMMNNPQIAQMMNNPQIAEMMKNPQIAQMAQSLMSDPDAMKSMLDNPALASMAAGLGKK